MPRTVKNDPLQKYSFRVSVPGLPAGMGFSKVSSVSREVGVAEYNEGTAQYTQKFPGKEKFAEVVCERGEYASYELRDLYKKTVENSEFRNVIVIERLSKDGSEVIKTEKLAEAWVSKFEGSDSDAGSNDIAIERITIQYEYLLDE